jgi:hypothetical protein
VKYFYDPIVYELGHAHGLGHINDDSSLMFRSTITGYRPVITSGSTYPGPGILLGAMDMIYTSVLPANAPGSLPGSCPFAQLDTIPRHCFDLTLSVPDIPENAYTLNLYPNPIGYGEITITWQLIQNSHIQFKIEDCIGRVIMNLNNENKPPGDYSEEVNINALAQGIYLFTANINGECQTIKFIKI